MSEQASGEQTRAERVRVGRVEDMPEGWQGTVTVDGVDVLVVNFEGTYYALRNNCTHKDFPLLGGDVVMGRITCEKHGAKFELSTGRAKTLPAVKAVRIYATETEDGVLHVRPL